MTDQWSQYENDPILRDLIKRIYDKHRQWFEDSIALLQMGGYDEAVCIAVVTSEIVDRASTVVALSNNTEGHLRLFGRMVARKKAHHARQRD